MKPWMLLFAGVLLLVAGWTSEARAWVAALTVSPAAPTPADSIQVTATSIDPVGLWVVGPTTCAVVSGDTLVMTLPVDFWCSSINPDLSVRYVRTCAFQPLRAGTYVARFVESHFNPCDPETTETATVTFTVRAPTPTKPRSWGALKSGYR